MNKGQLIEKMDADAGITKAQAKAALGSFTGAVSGTSTYSQYPGTFQVPGDIPGSYRLSVDLSNNVSFCPSCRRYQDKKH